MFHIYHDLPIQAPAVTIFNAITQPAGLEAWWTVKSAGLAQAGAEYQFYFAPEYDWRAVVSEIEQAKRVRFSFTAADADWTGTALLFEIQEEGETSLLSFSHQGWKTCNAHFKRTSYCWAQYLRCLKAFVEEGLVLPYAARGGS